ncbi:electron transfer flavoprotein beta subunit/FixA family protein [Spongiactinospora rosea]|uniref:Electron transfer flavoprotein beta subunit/FixA family protein n=1 Tax=Spongiactinospora rosea TaxID=2248750 RepID=A0A366M0S4_9ACTN|nr:electron transfer flavoprotein subunit beta/FixA family protein [Spongiactinospora rosea]RBQ19400.1 electron transfer flavoprotein beta subunit/FixA family protein [Spongiactinospora rosea]
MTMTILVPVKDVPAELRLRGGTLTREGLSHRLDTVNEVALEWALRLTDARVCVATMGPASAVSALRQALALGAGEAFLISDDALAGADVRTTARALAALARVIGADVVACGYESADGSSGAVPGALAACLGRPLVSGAAEAEFGEGVLTALRDTGSGSERVTVRPPAVLSFVDGALEPRRPRLRDVLAARSASPRVFSAADLGLDVPAPAVADAGVHARPLERGETRVLGLDEAVPELLTLLAGTDRRDG